MEDDKKIWSSPNIFDLDLLNTEGGGAGGAQDGVAENYRDPTTSPI